MWTFRFVAAVALPLAFLLGAETVLRVVGFGHDLGFTTPCVTDRGPSVCDNPQFTWRFFPPRIARTAPSFSFPAAKGQESYRIFVLGGSAAQGDPEPTYGFARILERLLDDRYPGVDFQVVNTAITAVNSHVVRLVAHDLVDHDPDLFIAYLGNNEVVGPYGPGSAFSPVSSNLGLIRSSIFLRGTRLGQLAGGLLAGGEDEAGASEWRGMEFFLDHRILPEDPRMATVYDHFRENLQAIAEAGQQAGASVLLSTVGADLLDSPPFASAHSADLSEEQKQQWERAYARGVEAHDAGRHAEALTAYRDAERIDPTFAELQFRLGQTLRAGGDPIGARSCFATARELDTLGFRADARINEIIRAVAHEGSGRGVHLLDAEQVFAAASPHGVPGEELFVDHVHLTFRANYLLAEAILLELRPLLPESIRARDEGRAPLSESECASRLAYTDFDRQRVASLMLARRSRPPFTNRFDHAARVERLRERVEELGALSALGEPAAALSAYDAAIRLAPDDPWLRINHARLLGDLGLHGPAAADLRVFLDRLPQDIQARERLAAALAEQGEFEAAVVACRETLALAPRQPASYYTLAYSLANLSRLDESIATYHTLLEVDPGSWVRIRNEIGRIEIHRGRFDAAIRTFEEAIRRGEESGETKMPDLHFNFGFALKRAGEPERARGAFRVAAEQYGDELTMNPSAQLHMALGSTLVEAGDLPQAASHFGEAAGIEPANVAAHTNLVRCLQAQGKAEAAAEAGLAGYRVLMAEGRTAEAERLRKLVE